MKEKLKLFFNKNKKYIETFIVAFSSYIAVNALVLDMTTKCAWYALIAGAIGSAISIMLNVVKKNK